MESWLEVSKRNQIFKIFEIGFGRSLGRVIISELAREDYQGQQ
jgi:hypothetical protein